MQSSFLMPPHWLNNIHAMADASSYRELAASLRVFPVFKSDSVDCAVCDGCSQAVNTICARHSTEKQPLWGLKNGCSLWDQFVDSVCGMFVGCSSQKGKKSKTCGGVVDAKLCMWKS